MERKVCLHLLLVFHVLCQGIIATLSPDDISKSSDVLARKKRVINLEPGGHLPTIIDRVPYIVNIKENGRSFCVGAILSHYTVITAERCVRYEISAYHVYSGSGYTHHSQIHNVTAKETYFGNEPHHLFDGITLISIDPPFVFTAKTAAINLHVGNLPAGTIGSVSGWGCTYPDIVSLTRKLRTITVPIMNQGECLSSYPRNLGISNKHICTYHEKKLCAHTDAGTPLVVNNMLRGIYVWKGEFRGINNPEVYINVQIPEYRNWIVAHTLLM